MCTGVPVETWALKKMGRLARLAVLKFVVANTRCSMGLLKGDQENGVHRKGIKEQTWGMYWKRGGWVWPDPPSPLMVPTAPPREAPENCFKLKSCCAKEENSIAFGKAPRRGERDDHS